MSIKPFFWSIANGIGTRGLSFVFFVIISRLITPSDFGIMALALTIAMVIDTLIEQGLSSAIVQRQDLTEEHISSTFVYQVCLALILWIILWISAQLIASLLKEQKLVQLLPWIGLASFFNALGYVKQGLLQRTMQFKILALRNITATTFGGLLGFWYAKQGAGVHSLVIMHVCNAVFGAIVLWTATGINIKFKLSKSKLKELLLFSRSVLGTRIIEVLASRLDQLMIGQYFGTTILGYYALAMRLYETLIQTTATPIADVAYPLFSKVQDNREKLSGAYLRLVEYIGGLTIPLFIAAAALAPFFVPTFFGQQWEPAIWYVVIILALGSLNSISTYNDVLLSAVGRPDLRFKLAAVGLSLWLVSAVVLLPLGGFYAVIAWGIRTVIMFPIKLANAFRFMRIALSEYILKIGRLFLAGGIMTCMILGIEASMTGYNLVLIFVAQVISGLIIYFVSLHVFGSPMPARMLKFRQVINE